MAYLLDSNTFIEAKNLYYGFDFCPAYWEWIIRENAAGRVFSIDRVLQELSLGKDELAIWAKARGEQLFLPLDEKASQSFSKVVKYIQSLPLPTTTTNKRDFLSVADPILIAHAAAHGHTVVTREVMVPSTSKKIKIPNICQNFGVPTMTPFEMMRQLKVSFQLETGVNQPAKEKHLKLLEERRIELAFHEEEIERAQERIEEKKEELGEVEAELEEQNIALETVRDELEALRQEKLELEADLEVPD